MREFVVYTSLRLGLFVGTYAVIVAAYTLISGEGAIPIFWPFLLAVVISSAASLYLLRGHRERFAAVVQRRAHRATQGFEAMRAKEDDDNGSR